MLSEIYWHPTNLYGDILRLPSHRAIQYLVNPRHEEGRWRALRLHVKPTDVVYDIGAEQGDLSALLASWVPDGGIVLVEPNERSWPTIGATFHENHLGPRLSGAYMGLLAANPAIQWRAASSSNWPNAIIGDLDPAAGFTNLAEQGEDYPVATLDLLAAEHGSPDVVNIDVEGAELEVLRGAERVLTEDRPVIALSVHPEFLNHWWDATPQQVLDLLTEHGYRCQLVHADHELHYLCLP